MTKMVCDGGAMTRTTFTIAVAFLCRTAAAAPLVTYESPCECRDNHGKRRWSEKLALKVQAVTINNHKALQ
jgi:hypothetical protein